MRSMFLALFLLASSFPTISSLSPPSPFLYNVLSQSTPSYNDEPLTSTTTPPSSSNIIQPPQIPQPAVPPTKQLPTWAYVPNLIGYARLLFLSLSLHYAYSSPSKPGKFSIFYATSALLDALDGKAARYLNQVSNLGGLLDMVTDRLTTSSMLIILTQVYKKYAVLWLGLMGLDISSHWMFQYYNALRKTHHKSSSKGAGRTGEVKMNPLKVVVDYYYRSPIFFAYCCLAPELFYGGLYILGEFDGFKGREVLRKFVWWGCFAGTVVKQVTNLAQLGEAIMGVDEVEPVV
ncbi:hypothetical protein TrVE_jg4618 [Triparma verrucosa]|uniref:CDP-diacylglycerol--inositol 3-phosphatidyltransferase n=1 Tax=Triparma verrucosa TaxID=1606542 RepID=A0A9W7BWR4_9STRA|nr:hypothetical protein TrVE_jg4618 [Triparma verrucosa]